jgi:hypothetical protein
MREGTARITPCNRLSADAEAPDDKWNICYDRLMTCFAVRIRDSLTPIIIW